MEVILLEKVQNLGNLGDKVNVKPGFGRNYLIPRGKAASATPANIAAFEARKAELLKAEAESLKQAQDRHAQMNDKVVTIAANVGDEGKLFGSIGTADIAQAMTAAGMPVQKQEVRLYAGSLRQVGEYDTTIHLHPDVNAHVIVKIVPEE